MLELGGPLENTQSSPCSAEGETEAQRGGGTCPQSRSPSVRGLASTPSLRSPEVVSSVSSLLSYFLQQFGV